MCGSGGGGGGEGLKAFQSLFLHSPWSFTLITVQLFYRALLLLSTWSGN